MSTSRKAERQEFEVIEISIEHLDAATQGLAEIL